MAERFDDGLVFEKCNSIRLETTGQAQNAPAPFTTYSLFYNGEFFTNEILSDKKFEKIIEEKRHKE